MKSKASAALALFVFSFFPAPLASGRQPPDFSLRRALYFTGKKADKIDLKNDKYVAAGATITLKKSEAKYCNYQGCSFNAGLVAFRNPAQGFVNVYVEMKREDGSIYGNSIHFDDKESTTQLVVPLDVLPGSKTKFTCLIDPENKMAETDENNNSFYVWIIVEP